MDHRTTGELCSPPRVAESLKQGATLLARTAGSLGNAARATDPTAEVCL